MNNYQQPTDHIANLAYLHTCLSQYITDHRDDLDPKTLARLLALHGQNASRLGRLLSHQATCSNQIPPELEAEIHRTLHEESPPFPAPERDVDSPPGSLTTPYTIDNVITIDDVIADLDQMQTWLFQHLNCCWDDPQGQPPIELHQVYFENVSRRRRLSRNRHAIYGAPPDVIEQAHNQALAQLSQELGIDLLGDTNF